MVGKDGTVWGTIFYGEYQSNHNYGTVFALTL
jgi:hypothetical protein